MYQFIIVCIAEYEQNEVIIIDAWYGSIVHIISISLSISFRLLTGNSFSLNREYILCPFGLFYRLDARYCFR